MAQPHHLSKSLVASLMERFTSEDYRRTTTSFTMRVGKGKENPSICRLMFNDFYKIMFNYYDRLNIVKLC